MIASGKTKCHNPLAAESEYACHVHLKAVRERLAELTDIPAQCKQDRTPKEWIDVIFAAPGVNPRLTLDSFMLEVKAHVLRSCVVGTKPAETKEESSCPLELQTVKEQLQKTEETHKAKTATVEAELLSRLRSQEKLLADCKAQKNALADELQELNELLKTVSTRCDKADEQYRVCKERQDELRTQYNNANDDLALCLQRTAQLEEGAPVPE